MKKSGFTLVELLAVIVILAIISLIATPMILNVIDNAKKGAVEASANGYIDALEKGIIEEEIKGNAIEKTGVYEISSLTFVNVKGDAPTKGWVSLNKGIVTDYSLKIGEYVINYDETNKKIVTTKNGELDETPGEEVIPTPSEPETGATMVAPQNGETHKGIVYLDPTNLSNVCDESNSTSTTGTKEGCMKWYIFDDSGDNYKMILDHNTTAKVAWNSSGSNADGINEAATALTNDTTTWNSSLSPRLIEANEVAAITGNTTFNQDTTDLNGWFYLDSNSQTQTATSQGASSYAWLYDYTNGCTSRGCAIEDSSTYGYWTSTPVSGDTIYAWLVGCCGDLGRDGVINGYYSGVRPVITVSKSVIS